MKRRTFIWLSTAGAASLYLPAGCNGRYTLSNKAVAQPRVLARICDAETLRQIGTAYRHAVPAEKDDRKLAALILKDGDGSLPKTTDGKTLETFLDQKITRDFEAEQTVVINGWVLSQTEARQCALFASQT